MRKPKQILTLLIVFFGLISIADQAKAQDVDFTQKILVPYDEAYQFLTDLGYEDYNLKAQKTLDTATEIHPVSKLALLNSVSRFGGIRSAKMLASMYYAFLSINDQLSADTRDKNLKIFLDIATQQMMPFPVVMLEPIQDSAYQNTKGKLAYEIREKYLRQRGVDRYNLEAKNLIKAYTFLYNQTEEASARAPEIFQNWIESHLYTTMVSQFTMSQQARYLGRALSAATVKFSRDKNQPQIEARLKKQLHEGGVELDDLLQARYHPLTENKNEPSFQLKNGDIALEFSLGQESYLTSMGVEPSNIENLKLAKKIDLISSFANIPLFAASKRYEEALVAKRSNAIMSEAQEKTIADYWDPKISKGFSHAAIVQIKHDAKTNISLAWIWDVYPDSRGGGVRMMTPEGFSFPESFIRVGFARYSAAKVLAEYKKQISERGYLENVLQSNESYVDTSNPDHHRAYANTSQNYFWPAQIEKEKVLNWAQNTKNENAEAWYQNEILPSVFDRIHRYTYEADAVLFAKGLVNARGMAYCSQIVRLAFLQATNFDVTNSSDRYRSIPKLMAHFFPDDLKLASSYFVAPAGLVWQSQLLDTFVKFDYSHERAEKQKISKTLASDYTNYVGKNADVAAEPLLIEASDRLELEDIVVVEED
ncbi:MAG: hypothetical protein H7328_03890 [Bdellovibrio sp.]|nr:hypothetical protein [Bdellovibrio sp.]